MSRVGKLPVAIPQDVQAEIKDSKIVIKGKLGELETPILSDVVVEKQDSQEENGGGSVIKVTPANDDKKSRAMWGTMRSLIANMVQGVSEGFSTRIEVKGVGYRAMVKGKFLVLSLGFSHDIYYAIPEGIEIACEKQTLIIISGASKQLVGQVAGELIAFRPVEPYKGKGVFIEGSYIRRKEGKKK